MTAPYETFLNNLATVRAAVAQACAEGGRDPATVSILPVTKNHPVEAVRHAARAGLMSVGENRVQEASGKLPAAPPGVQWELIGHLQSNKAALAVATFDRIQSVDSTKLVERLDRAARERGRPLRVLLQINAGRDPAKHGCEIEDTPALVEAALQCRHLRLEGFMTIAPLDPDPAVARRTFDTLRELRDDLAARLSVSLPELSMGMSGDLREAILAGSTQVRIGTALFGVRL